MADENKPEETKTAPSKKKKSNSKPKGALLYSRLNHPVELSYGGESLIVPPNARDKKIDNAALLGAVPKGIIIKHLK